MSDNTRVFVDLFPGPDRRRVDCPGGAHRAFIEADGWEVLTVGWAEHEGWDLKPDVEADLFNLRPEDLPLDRPPAVVWASPPCTAHSMASMGHHWTKDRRGHYPDTEDAVFNTYLALRTVWLIRQLDPAWWFMENPRGKMRKVLPIRHTGTIWYCQYGHEAAKPTDLWGHHPPSFKYKMCGPDAGGCDHERAQRGESHAGTQKSGRDPVLRSIVPEGVSRAVLEAVEEPGGGRQASMEAYM